jgi:hypothetical protein
VNPELCTQECRPPAAMTTAPVSCSDCGETLELHLQVSQAIVVHTRTLCGPGAYQLQNRILIKMLDFVQAGWWPLQLLGNSLLIHLQLGGPHANVASTVVFLIFESLLVDHANKAVSPPFVMQHMMC